MSREQDRELAFVEEVKKTLKAKGEKLDPEVLIKLSLMQGGMSAGHGSRFSGLWRLIRLPALALLSAALIVMLTLVIFRGPATLQHSFAGLEDLDLLTSSVGPDFYADLDFYGWLASQETDENQRP